jgi:HK97 family phage prohead protease
MQVIYRSIDNVNAVPESRTISGYAVVFDSWSRDLGGFQEIIHRGSITQDLINQSDVIMNINHDDDKMVARSYKGDGTLRLELREDGLFFEFEAPTTQLGDELLFNVRNRNLFECSFAFALDTNDETCQRWYREDSAIKREINKIAHLVDCSIVTHAAYGATSCSTRSLNTEDVTSQIQKFEEEEQRKLEQEKILSKLDRMKADMENITV